MVEQLTTRDGGGYRACCSFLDINREASRNNSEEKLPTSEAKHGFITGETAASANHDGIDR